MKEIKKQRNDKELKRMRKKWKGKQKKNKKTWDNKKLKI